MRSCCCRIYTGRAFAVSPVRSIQTGMLAKIHLHLGRAGADQWHLLPFQVVAPCLGSPPHTAILKLKERDLVGRQVREGPTSVAVAWRSPQMRSQLIFNSSSSSQPRPQHSPPERMWPPGNRLNLNSTSL
ncbi:uncharacterized protein LOC101732715 isoform X2 [Xenopus tropicalis]|uniref:Uncharacterized protein LOC101732715 isoform X2 n=1 Tax=Xenopus tropicalis TaxID=8364 RepID=A0A8J0SRF4_XENTR|nr:uncharacterized protein LOC101732715 isoform X2 [Xenopus tropicalis]